MAKTTKAQRRAIKKVWLRGLPNNGPSTYRETRKLVQATFGCDGAVCLPWCGMWLCIERDGYTHS